MAGRYVDDHNNFFQKEEEEEHYMKLLSTGYLVPACSAHLGVTKRSMHIKDCVQIMYNCSKLLKWEEAELWRKTDGSDHP